MSISEPEAQGTKPTIPPKLLDVRDLRVGYGKAAVVHGVSFSMMARELVVFLGRNGAGKSTILHAISGADPKARWRG